MLCYGQIPLGRPDQTLSETSPTKSGQVRSGLRQVRGLCLVIDLFIGQIPLERPDPTGPDRTRPDEYFRVSDQVSDQVSGMSTSTSETLSLTKSETFVT